MEKYNEYGCLSGGYIFDYLDKESHEKAKELIGDNVTITGEIKYMGLASKEDLYEKTHYNCVKVGKNKVIVDTNTDSKVFGRFVFIERK